MPLRTAPLCCLLFLPLIWAGCGFGADDPTQVIDALETRFEANTNGVDGYTLFVDEMVVHIRPNTADSLTAFDIGISLRDSNSTIPENAHLVSYLVPDIPKLIRGLRTGAKLIDDETFNGRRVNVIEAHNPTALIVGGDGPAADIDRALVYVDAETGDLRGVTMEMPPPDTSSTEMIVQRVRYEQFRAVDGMTIPFKVITTTEGLRGLIPDEMRIVENGGLAIARSQAEQLPPGERAVELARIAVRERFLNEGIQEDVLTIDSVRVGGEIPAGVFGENGSG